MDLFDFDNHYYEAEDAFTRHQDPSLGNRGVRWAEVDGRKRLLVGGTVNSYIANPTFTPVAKPGSLYEWYRGNPEKLHFREAFGELEPIRPEYRDRDARLRVMDEQGLVGALLFPTLGVGVEDALRDDPQAASLVFRAFNRWLDEDWGFAYANRLWAVPHIPLLDPANAAVELQAVLDAGAIVVNVRSAPVPAPGGYRSPFAPEYEPFWSLAEESGVVIATHAGIDGYDALVQMWEPGGSESMLFRSPLRGIVTKGRAIADFYAAAMCHGIFDRHPGLRFASVENGGSWVAELLHRLDDAASINPGYFKDSPSDVFRERVWVTPFWEDQVPDLLEHIPATRVLLGSDWPHAEGTATPAAFVSESLSTLDPTTKQRIVHDNAVELLGVG